MVDYKSDKIFTFLSMTSHFFFALRDACWTELFLLGDFTGNPDGRLAAPENLEVEEEDTDTDELLYDV